MKKTMFRLTLLPLLLTALVPLPVHAGPVALSASDFSLGLSLYTEAGSWVALDPSNLAGIFGPHRCQCPENLAPTLQITPEGQDKIDNSVIGVTFYLGDNCFSVPASCTSIGQVTFSTPEGSTPQFSSQAVFAAASGGTSPSCTQLSASNTTLWANLTQNGQPLSFPLSIGLPISATTVGAPTGVTAEPANESLMVRWTPPADASLVAGYQVLCLPRPAEASTAGYESCGLTSNPGATVFTPADPTQLCSAALPSSTTSVRVDRLTNGTAYTVAVIAIDPSGGTSAPSSPAAGTPQPTTSFWDKYKQAGGAASGCSLFGLGASGAGEPLGGAAVALILFGLLHRRRQRSHRARQVACLSVLLLSQTARAEDSFFNEPALKDRSDANFERQEPPRLGSAPAWGVQIGISLYRPDVDSEFKKGTHPYADTFSNSRHLLSVAELDRYLFRRFGTWGVGLRGGYYRASAAAFLGDGITRSGDQTRLSLIPFSLSLLYLANGLPGLRRVPLTPYAKVGLDGTVWTASSTGESSHRGLSMGWHATAGLMLGFTWLGANPSADDIASPCALFFEWSYAAINGLGMSHALHVGDNTWFAGIAFDI